MSIVHPTTAISFIDLVSRRDPIRDNTTKKKPIAAPAISSMIDNTLIVVTTDTF